MSRRRVFIRTVVAMVGALVAGATIATASPTAVVATATKCKGSTGNAGTAGATFGYVAALSCNGPFSKFTLRTNKPVAAGTARGTVTFTKSSNVPKLSCGSTANTVTCKGVPAHPYLVHVFYNSTQACNNPPKLTSRVTVNGKTFKLNASCT